MFSSAAKSFSERYEDIPARCYMWKHYKSKEQHGYFLFVKILIMSYYNIIHLDIHFNPAQVFTWALTSNDHLENASGAWAQRIEL